MRLRSSLPVTTVSTMPDPVNGPREP